MAPKNLKRPRKRHRDERVEAAASVESSNSSALRRQRALKSSKKLKINMIQWMEGAFNDTYLDLLDKVVSRQNHGIEGVMWSINFWEGFTKKLNTAIRDRPDIDQYPNFLGYSVTDVVEYGKFLRDDYRQQLESKTTRKTNYSKYKKAFGLCGSCQFLSFLEEATLKGGKKSKGSSGTSQSPCCSGGITSRENSNSNEVNLFIKRISKLVKWEKITLQLARNAVDTLAGPNKANYRIMFMALSTEEQVVEIVDLCQQLAQQ